MKLTISTTSFDEASIVRASGIAEVTTIKKPCSPKALFTFADTPAVRDLLARYMRGERLPISPRHLLIIRADLYREARSARGGL